jgi:hypothetical protein
MQQRTVWKIFYNDNGKDVTMWVDDYYGVPVKVWVQDGSTKNEYVFEDIGFEAVDESDLQHNLVN